MLQHGVRASTLYQGFIWGLPAAARPLIMFPCHYLADNKAKDRWWEYSQVLQRVEAVGSCYLVVATS